MRLILATLICIVLATRAFASDPCMGMKVVEGSYAKRAANPADPRRMEFGAKQADMHDKRMACEAAAAKAPHH
jgi:hypothetical protein